MKKKENAESGEMSLVKVSQFLAKPQELSDIFLDSDPKVDRAFEFVNRLTSLLDLIALFRNFINAPQKA